MFTSQKKRKKRKKEKEKKKRENETEISSYIIIAKSVTYIWNVA